MEAKEGSLAEVRSRRKSVTADAKGAVLDGRRRISVMQADLEHQARSGLEQLRREIAAEEKAMAEEQKAILAEAAQRAKQDEALRQQEQAWALREAAFLRATQAGAKAAAAAVARGGVEEAAAAAAAAAEEAAAGERLSPRSVAECGVDAAVAAAEDLALVRGRSVEDATAVAAAAGTAVRAAQAESSAAERRTRTERALARLEERAREAADLRHQMDEVLAKKERLALEKLDIEVELESEQKCCEQERLARGCAAVPKPALEGIDELDLSCLRAELAARKELAERELAECRHQLGEAEASLSAASEAAAEHRAAEADRRKAFALLEPAGPAESEEAQPMGLLQEARAARLVAAESLEAVRTEVERKHRLEEAPPAPASIVADSELSEDVLRFEFVLDGEVLQSQVIFPPEAGASSRFQQLIDEAEELETRNLLLAQEKRELTVRLSAAKFALRRCEDSPPRRAQVAKLRKGCPFCEHCQREEHQDESSGQWA